MTTGKITEIVNFENSSLPVMVTFQNGAVSSDKVDKLSCGLYTDKDRLVAVVASDKCVYTGTVSRDDDLYNNFILIRNKKTEECKLRAINKAILNIVPTQKRKLEDVALSKQKQTAELTRYFGSKKSKMITEQSERLKVDVENIKDTLEQTAKVTKVNESVIIPFKQDENDSLYRPPINRNATKVDDIYPLDILIPLDLLEDLENSANELLETEEEKLTLCDFVKREFIGLQKSASTNTLRAQLFLYIDCLINMVKQQAKAIANKKFVACIYSSRVAAHILESFTVMSATGRTRPISMRDKCICYIMVLSILACNKILNLELLSKELKLGVKRLQDLSRILSFSTKGTDKTIAHLSLPLPAPVSTLFGKKRK